MSAEEPRFGKRLYHIQVRPGEISEYVLLPGDPGRVPVIAELWDEGREIAYHREFRVWSGKVNGRPISACSTGIGASSAATRIEP